MFILGFIVGVVLGVAFPQFWTMVWNKFKGTMIMKKPPTE